MIDPVLSTGYRLWWVAEILVQAGMITMPAWAITVFVCTIFLMLVLFVVAARAILKHLRPAAVLMDALPTHGDRHMPSQIRHVSEHVHFQQSGAGNTTFSIGILTDTHGQDEDGQRYEARDGSMASTATRAEARAARRRRDPLWPTEPDVSASLHHVAARSTGRTWRRRGRRSEDGASEGEDGRGLMVRGATSAAAAPSSLHSHRAWRRRRISSATDARRATFGRNTGLSASQISLAAVRIDNVSTCSFPSSSSSFHTPSISSPFYGIHSRLSGVLCTICLEEVTQANNGCRLAVCGHQFHELCIHNWLRRVNKCPNCQRVALHTGGGRRARMRTGARMGGRVTADRGGVIAKRPFRGRGGAPRSGRDRVRLEKVGAGRLQARVHGSAHAHARTQRRGRWSGGHSREGRGSGGGRDGGRRGDRGTGLGGIDALRDVGAFGAVGAASLMPYDDDIVDHLISTMQR